MTKTEKTAEETAPHVYTAISEVLAALAKEGIGKDQENTFDRYKFRGIDDVYNALSKHLAAHGLLIIPSVKNQTTVERPTNKGGTQLHVTMDVEYTLVSKQDGSNIQTTIFGEAMDRGDKAINKAMSAAYKLLCFQLFCIPVEGQNADSEQDSPQIDGKSSAPKAFQAMREGAKDPLEENGIVGTRPAPAAWVKKALANMDAAEDVPAVQAAYAALTKAVDDDKRYELTDGQYKALDCEFDRVMKALQERTASFG